MSPDDPQPEPPDWSPFHARRRAGEPFKGALEELLRRWPREQADRLTQKLKPGHAAWYALLRSSGGRALFVGAATSGIPTGLAAVGFEVTSLDASLDRSLFGHAYTGAYAPGARHALVADAGEPLPFADGAFDLCVLDGDVDPAPPLAELARVTRGELVWLADNRFGYKVSSGQHWDYHVPGPLEYARQVLGRAPRLVSLGAARARLGREFGEVRAYALYPHRRDFAQIVALDEETPRLAVGPLERRNRLKIAAQRLGLFRTFTPSYCFVASRREGAPGPRPPRRIERMLAQLAEHVGEPLPEPDEVAGTRGNTGLVQTAVPGGGASPAGRFTLHTLLCRSHRSGFEKHFRAMETLRRAHPGFPVPDPLFCGELDGVFLTCERRLGGWPAYALDGRPAAEARMLRESAEHLSGLQVRPPRPLTDADFDELFESKLDLVRRHAGRRESLERLTTMGREAREVLVGRPLPLVYQHGDLRPKHLMVRPDGEVLGFLDWGTAQEADLPYHDLFHLVVHNRRRADRVPDHEAWQRVLDPDRRRPEEEAALSDYARRAGLDRETARALERLYPVLVGYTAEAHWSYSRPHWLHRAYKI